MTEKSSKDVRARWWMRFWRETARPILVVLIVVGSFRSAVADWHDVPTGSFVFMQMPDTHASSYVQLLPHVFESSLTLTQTPPLHESSVQSFPSVQMFVSLPT